MLLLAVGSLPAQRYKARTSGRVLGLLGERCRRRNPEQRTAQPVTSNRITVAQDT